MITPEPMNKPNTGTLVPLKSLAIDGTNPEQGDEVAFTAKGRIASIDGENALIELTEVNEQAVDTAPAAEPDGDEMAMKAAMDADNATP
jgi:hypothetical protein